METDPSLGTQAPITAQETAQREQAESFSRNFEALGLAWHGIRARMADRRMEFSGSRMEKTDHKDALYYDLGWLAVTGDRIVSPTANGRPAMPRTAVERFMDSRMDKRAHKKSVTDTYAYRASKVFGAADSLPGASKSEKRRAQRELINRQLRGEITAREAREEATEVRAQPLKLGEEMHKRTNKDRLKAIGKLHNSIDSGKLRNSVKPRLVQRWRRSRRRAAISDIKRHHSRAEHHRQKIESIREKRLGRAQGTTSTLGQSQNTNPGQQRSVLFDQDTM